MAPYINDIHGQLIPTGRFIGEEIFDLYVLNIPLSLTGLLEYSWIVGHLGGNFGMKLILSALLQNQYKMFAHYYKWRLL